ncbi:MAG: hypothetical protein RR797_01305 [Christensenella sp.]
MKNSEAIKMLIKETKVSQVQLAKYIGVKGQSNVSEAIKNNVKSTMTLIAMAEAMGYEVVLQRKRPGKRPEGQIVLDGDQK